MTRPQHQVAETGSIADIETVYREQYSRFLRFAVATSAMSSAVAMQSTKPSYGRSGRSATFAAKDVSNRGCGGFS